MTLITILIGAALERFVGTLQQYRTFEWFTAYIGWLRSKTSPAIDGPWAVLLVLAPVLATVQFFIHAIGPVLGFAIAVAVLVWSLGPRALTPQVESFVEACEREDYEAASLHAADFNPTLGETGKPAQLIQGVSGAILTQANERYLAVIFWFLLLGPAGALLYRLSSQLRDNASRFDETGDFTEAAQKLHYILAWLPARVTAFSYGLVGSMADTLNNWRDYDSKWAEHYSNRNTGILTAAGFGALKLEPDEPDSDLEQVIATMALVNRAFLVWIGAIAVLSLAGMAG